LTENVPQLGPADLAVDDIYKACDRVVAQLAPSELDDLRGWPKEPLLVEFGMRYLLGRDADQIEAELARDAGPDGNYWGVDVLEEAIPEFGALAILANRKLRTAGDLARWLEPRCGARRRFAGSIAN
jgi:hypothetical protein